MAPRSLWTRTQSRKWAYDAVEAVGLCPRPRGRKKTMLEPRYADQASYRWECGRVAEHLVALCGGMAAWAWSMRFRPSLAWPAIKSVSFASSDFKLRISTCAGRGGATEVRLNRALPGLSYCQTLRRVVLSTTHKTPTMTWSYSNSTCNIGVFLGSIVVSILPCQSSGPGSIPGRGALLREINFTFLGELTSSSGRVKSL